jgi:hypothetical protein
MKKKLCQFQNWFNYLSVRKCWKNMAVFTKSRYVRGIAVLLHSVLALALKGGECSTLHLTTSHPDKEPHYPLIMGLGGL